MGQAVRYKQPSVPRQQGEQARLKVIQGPDLGVVYVILGFKATIGRGENNDVVITDLKASRNHAEISSTGVGWKVKDMGSANGILMGGKFIRESGLRTGEAFSVGETTLEFMTSEAGTMMLMAPPKQMAQVEADQAQREAQQRRIHAMTSIGGGGSLQQGVPGDNGKNKFLLILALGGVAAWLFLSEEPKKSKNQQIEEQATQETETSRNLAAYLPKPESPEANRDAERIYRTGFREFREKNYLRAKTHFETVLQIDPGHSLATLYLQNCEKAIEDDVKALLERGKKALDMGRLQESKTQFESVLRLMYFDQSSPSYLEAKDQLEKVKTLMKGEG